MDWPLSREEKKCCAMQLYERDVQAANELLESKDEALTKANEEIKELRRASTASTTARASIASTTATGARSSLSESPADCKEAEAGESEVTEGKVSDAIDSQPAQHEASKSPCAPAAPPASDIPAPRLSMGSRRFPDSRLSEQRERSTGKSSPPARNAAMQRSSSLEVFSNVSSWWEVPKADGSRPRAHSPRRHGAQQRSSSLEKTASSFWGSIRKGVGRVARDVTQTATETARLLADEARTVAEEVKELGKMYQDPGCCSGTANGKQSKGFPPTEFIEWFIDFEPGSGKTGLELEQHVDGEPWRVSRVTKGEAVDDWNAEPMPVTVYLYPGRREKVMRRMVVRPKDELFAVDGEPLMPDHDLLVEGDSVRRVRKCKALTFRRKIPPALQRVSTDVNAC